MIAESDRSGTLGFILPRFRRDVSIEGLFSFRKEVANILGLFLPGHGSVVFDPISLKNDTPFATLVHEDVHQSLMINTSYGIFHQNLEHYAKGSATMREACRMSLEEQWSVQELAATYSEMTEVAERYPQLLEKSITLLPSDILDEPPYREVYDSVAQYLPVLARFDLVRLTAQKILLSSMAYWSMSNDCLLKFADPRELTIERLRLYLQRESPHHRFERLMTELLSTRALWKLLERAALTATSPDAVTGLMAEIPLYWENLWSLILK